MFKKNPPLKILLTLVFIMSIFYGCTKMDISLEKQPKDVILQFFKLKGTESPAVIKVVGALKEQNALTDFIPGFAQKDGYAVWDKSIVQQPVRKTYNRNGEEEETAETLVFTPIVETDSNFVNGFFFSRIVGDSTELHLYRASDYDIFPFGETDSSLVTAELITTAILQLNGNIFGHRKYKLTDNRLFEKLRYDSNHTNKFRTIELDTIHNTGEISKKATGFICEVVPSGVCHCGPYCLDWWENCPICSMIYCVNLNTGGGSPPPAPNWPPDPGPDPFPIPSSYPGEGGGGGSSGSNTPPDDGDCTGLGNCRQSSLIIEGRVPCGGCGPGPVVVVPIEDEPNIYPNSDSLLADISRNIKRKADSIFNLSTQQNNNEWGMIIVRKNGVIYAKNEKTDNDPNYVKFNWFLQSGEELIGDFHIHNDNDSLDRSSFSGDDLTALRRNKGKYQYVKFVDCGNIRYAFIVEDVTKVNSFFSENKETIVIDTIFARAYRHPLRYTNWQLATQATMENYIGLSSVNGIGFYKSNNSDKTSYTKLN